ncbi:MAG: fimbrillin family protein, partial [Prevotella sp.]|nr:fimbrillin family protein [Prevotella sp.]
MKHILYILLVAIAFAACSTDTLLETEKMPMDISVDVASFAGKTQDVSTRASVNNGIYTTFAEGDDLGVFVVDKDGNLVADNLKFKVAKTGNAYPVDGSGNVVASKIYYDSECTYFAYAPYDAQYTGCKSVAEIKEKYASVFNTKYADQSTQEKYCAADLLICDNPEWIAPRMRFSFTHAMSLLQVFYNGDYSDLTIEAPVTLGKMFLPEGKSTYRYVTLPRNEVQIYGMALSKHTDESEAPSYSFWQTKVDMKENSAILISISSQPTESYKTAGVDMGFPSGCIWAAYNLGSESEAEQTKRGGKWYDAYGNEKTYLMSSELHKSFDRGDYYSWGELETKYERPA